MEILVLITVVMLLTIGVVQGAGRSWQAAGGRRCQPTAAPHPKPIRARDPRGTLPGASGGYMGPLAEV
jgi:hypothetical protein